jgi:hypothetical protein
VSRDDLAPEDVLTAAELVEHYRAKRDRSLSCNDGLCGGCPRSGYHDDQTEEAPCV